MRMTAGCCDEEPPPGPRRYVARRAKERRKALTRLVIVVCAVAYGSAYLAVEIHLAQQPLSSSTGRQPPLLSRQPLPHYHCHRPNATLVMAPTSVLIGAEDVAPLADWLSSHTILTTIDDHGWFTKRYHDVSTQASLHAAGACYTHALYLRETSLQAIMLQHWRGNRGHGRWPSLSIGTPLTDPTVPEALATTLPWAHVLVILRNPMDRFVAECLAHNQSLTTAIDAELAQLRARGWTHVTSRSDVDPWHYAIPLGVNRRQEPAAGAGPQGLRRGMYSIDVEQWLRQFPRYSRQAPNQQSMLILPYELWREHPTLFADKVRRFVGVADNALPPMPDLAPTTVEMDDDVRDFLTRLYRPYLRQLEDLLGARWQGMWRPGYDWSQWLAED